MAGVKGRSGPNKKHGELGTIGAERLRAKIKAGMILDRLKKHVLGEDEMSATQIRAAEILLNKTLPNLQQTDSNVNVTGDLIIERTSYADNPAVPVGTAAISDETPTPPAGQRH
jgi:hypothetical protein